MRKLTTVAALMAVFLLPGCLTVTGVITAAEVATRIGKTIADAKSEHPDDLGARIEVYAGLYCQFRDDYGMAWEDIRSAAIAHGAPVSTVDRVRDAISRECGL
jgi:hypothetical protein